MELYILRHAIAADRGTGEYRDDAERPLTTKGKRELRQIVKVMRTMDLSFDLILSSPFLRARETAEITSKGLGSKKKLQLTETLEPGGSFKELIKSLKESKREKVLLVGHEPFLSEFISLLISGDRRSLLTLKKAGLCKLTTESLAHGRCAILEWLLAPRHMRLMS
jgi:phosphohistidine phosphatase